MTFNCQGNKKKWVSSEQKFNLKENVQANGVMMISTYCAEYGGWKSRGLDLLALLPIRRPKRSRPKSRLPSPASRLVRYEARRAHNDRVGEQPRRNDRLVA